MNTFLSSSQEAVREQYNNFASEAVAPVIRELESHKICLKEFLQNAGQKGYLGMAVPKEYGGQGQPFLYCALFVEALAQYEAGLGLTLANHYAVIETLKKYGSETQKSRYLPLLARGEIIATLAFSEAQAGTDMRAVQSSFNGDQPILTGKKSWVVTGDFAGLFLTLCKNSQTNHLAVVFTDAGDKIKIGPNLEMLGLKSAYVNNLEFDSVALASEAILSKPSSQDAERIADFALDVSKVILAAAAAGLTRGAIKCAVDHARRREQFGVSIGQFQGVQWKLADMETENTAAILQVYRAAWSLGEADEVTWAKNAAMAKLFASRVARFHSGEALQVLGASGLMEDGLMEKMYRDAKAMEICLGTSEAQKIKLAELLNI